MLCRCRRCCVVSVCVATVCNLCHSVRAEDVLAEESLRFAEQYPPVQDMPVQQDLDLSQPVPSWLSTVGSFIVIVLCMTLVAVTLIAAVLWRYHPTSFQAGLRTLVSSSGSLGRRRRGASTLSFGPPVDRAPSYSAPTTSWALRVLQNDGLVAPSVELCQTPTGVCVLSDCVTLNEKYRPLAFCT